MLDINARKRYEHLFGERFQRRPNTCINKKDPESILNFINEIQKEYDKIIHEINKKGDNAAANNYVNSERIRLIARGNEIDKSELTIQYFNSLVPTTLSFLIFIVGMVYGNSNAYMKFVVENKLAEADPVADVIAKGKIMDIFADWTDFSNRILMRGFHSMMAALFVLYTALEIRHSYVVQKNIIDRTFNTFCLEVLENIDNKT